MPKCIIYQVTGFKCAGCGSQRAIHALLHGDLEEAWRMNAFMILMIPVVVFLGIVEMRRKSSPALYGKIHSPLFIVLLGIAIIGWTIGRNIF